MDGPARFVFAVLAAKKTTPKILLTELTRVIPQISYQLIK